MVAMQRKNNGGRGGRGGGEGGREKGEGERNH